MLHRLPPCVTSDAVTLTLDKPAALSVPVYRQWIRKEVCSEDLAKDSNLGELSKRLLKKSDLPEFEARDLTLDALIEEGDRLVYEVRSPCPARLQALPRMTLRAQQQC